MIYLSKGLVCKGSTEELLSITHHGQHFTLPNQLAHVWLNGRYKMVNTINIQEENALRQLVRMGLAEAEEKDCEVSKYRILSRCILYPTTNVSFQLRRMQGKEKVALTWLRKAGLRLSTAELVCLFEKGILPSEDYYMIKTDRHLLRNCIRWIPLLMGFWKPRWSMQPKEMRW